MRLIGEKSKLDLNYFSFTSLAWTDQEEEKVHGGGNHACSVRCRGAAGSGHQRKGDIPFRKLATGK